MSLSPERLSEIKARADAATKGPWRWFGSLRCRSLYLATLDRGRVYVMDFVRWGTGGAQARFQSAQHLMVKASELPGWKDYGGGELVRLDHPDARFIEHAREDADVLLEEVERLRVALEAMAVNRCDLKGKLKDGEGCGYCGFCRMAEDAAAALRGEA